MIFKNYPLLLLLYLAPSILSAQTFLESPKVQQPLSFTEFQLELHEWAKQKDLKTTKGWKWLKRWEDFNAKRMNPDGSTFDPAIYAQEMEKVMAMKSSTKKVAATNWQPYGPNDYATPSDPSWEPGIGRINCIAFHPTNADVFYVGVAQGGVWKTTDAGTSWTPLTDDLPMLRVSDIAIDPADPNTMYISMGDYAYFGTGLTFDDRKRHTHYGLGLYKTTDGGLSWNPTGLSFPQTDFDFTLIRRTIINPTNTSELIAGGTNGIYHSLDAGNNWTKVNDSLIWDLEQDPNNSNVLYAATGYRATLNLGTAGVLKSTDFGSSWTALNTGIPPTGSIQRVELAISRSNSNYIYALCANMYAGFGGLYRSTDAGATWSMQSSSPNILHWSDGTGIGGQGWYDLALLVNPNDENTIYSGGVNMWGSTDGGQSWNGCSYWRNYYGASLHADQHQFQFNPLDSAYYICNDGGLYSTSQINIGSWADANTNPGYQWPTSWTPLSGGMQATSFYRLGTDPTSFGRVVAGAQDNSTYYFDNQGWANILGGDGMECFFHPTNPDIIYGSSQHAATYVSMDGGQNFNWAGGSISETGGWTTPWMLDPNDPSTVLLGLGNVWKSTDNGVSYTQISNFPVNNPLGQSNYCSALAVGPSNSNYIYCTKRFYQSIGEPSALWVTTDGGTNWANRSAGLPDSLYLTYISIDGDDPATAWVTAGGFTPGAKVFKTTNAGASWVNVSSNLPNLPANCIVHDQDAPNNPVYIGMDAGVYYTNDTMSAWTLYSDDLPNVVVSELEIHRNGEKLVAATFGRGIWSVDLKDAVGTGVDGPAVRSVDMEVFPNPNQGNFTVRLGKLQFHDAQLEVVDVMGRVLYKEALSFQGKEYQGAFQTELSGGMYFVRVVKGNLSVSQRILIE